MFNKKGSTGKLIVFISIIMVAGIAAGVLIQTGISLQNQALASGSRTQHHVSTSFQTLVIYGEDGSDGAIERYYLKVKLSPGSDPLRFDRTLLEYDSVETSSEHVFGELVRGINNSHWTSLDQNKCDFNNDGVTDSVMLYNSTHLSFNISDSGGYVNYYGPLVFPDGNNLSSASLSNPVEVNTLIGNITVSGEIVGTYHVFGEVTSSSQLNDDIVVIIGNGQHGAYAVKYLVKSKTAHNEVSLNRGEVALIIAAAPFSVPAETLIKLNFIPQSGNSIAFETETPSLINTRRVFIYP